MSSDVLVEAERLGGAVVRRLISGSLVGEVLGEDVTVIPRRDDGRNIVVELRTHPEDGRTTRSERPLVQIA